MSTTNNIDPGLVPPYLPELSDIEQLLIAPIYISMHVYYIKGAQYRYKGHVITFLRNVPLITEVLLRLLQEYDTILIRPRQRVGDRGTIVTRQFKKAFTIRRYRVQAQLKYHIKNYLRFKSIRINPNRLYQLPNDSDAFDDIQTIEVNNNDSAKPNIDPNQA